jgi:hypothetical protein
LQCAVSNQQRSLGLFQQALSNLRHMANRAQGTDARTSVRSTIHDRRIQFDLSIFIGQTSITYRAILRIVLHDGYPGYHGI